MTTAGKVFSVLSFLLAIVFLFLMTPVVKNLVDTQKQIEDIAKQHPPLKQAAADLEKQRLDLTYSINREKDKVSAELTRAKNQLDVVRSQLSLLTDMQKAEAGGVLTWQDTIKGINAEIEARTAEKANLESEITTVTEQRDARQGEVQTLQETLAKTTARLVETLQTNWANYQRLEESTPAPASSTDNSVAEQQ